MAYNKNDFLAGVIAGRALHGRHIGANGAPVHVEGDLYITANGEYDVTNYETATVDIPLKVYTWNEILAGTKFRPVWVNTGITCRPVYVIDDVGADSMSWTFVFECSGMYHPQTTDELIGLMLPPFGLDIPGGDYPSRIITLPGLAGTYWGEYTAGASAEDMDGCGIRIEQVDSGFITCKPTENIGGTLPDSLLLSSTECYAVYVTGDGWERPETTLNFTMEIPFTTPIEGGALVD